MKSEMSVGRLPEGPTGRQIITFAPVDPGTAAREARDVAGLHLENAGEVGAFGTLDEVAGDGVYFEELGIAVVDSAPDQLGALSRAVNDSASPILAVEPEVYVHVFDTIEATAARCRKNRFRTIWPWLSPRVSRCSIGLCSGVTPPAE